MSGIPNGIRTRVAALKDVKPGLPEIPVDDGKPSEYSHLRHLRPSWPIDFRPRILPKSYPRLGRPDAPQAEGLGVGHGHRPPSTRPPPRPLLAPHFAGVPSRLSEEPHRGWHVGG